MVLLVLDNNRAELQLRVTMSGSVVVWVTDRSVLKDESGVVGGHTFRLLGDLFDLIFENFGLRNFSGLGVLRQFLLLLVQVDQTLAIVSNGITQLEAEIRLDKLFEAFWQFFRMRILQILEMYLHHFEHVFPHGFTRFFGRLALPVMFRRSSGTY